VALIYLGRGVLVLALRPQLKTVGLQQQQQQQQL